MFNGSHCPYNTSIVSQPRCSYYILILMLLCLDPQRPFPLQNDNNEVDRIDYTGITL